MKLSDMSYEEFTAYQAKGLAEIMAYSDKLDAYAKLVNDVRGKLAIWDEEYSTP